MANIKSAKKRILVTETKTARNKAIKSKVKTYGQHSPGVPFLQGLLWYKQALRRCVPESSSWLRFR